MKTRVLGIDIGMKRTGLAVSDELGISARALPNRIPGTRLQDVEFVISIVNELDVGVIVVGYPVLPHSGDEGPMAKRARGFKEALESAISEFSDDIIVVLLEECYSSKNAAKRLIESGIKKNKRATMLDSEVARILVEEYLSTHPERRKGF